ncbi:tetratricopeptide repeat protein [Singulisphaera sp. PoT]|uniref:tetratricopeptide repeat protein n=1 Tax=Singulisphaera sp. PoT TaxID=3411797 RepID=UPI003BF5D57D
MALLRGIRLSHLIALALIADAVALVFWLTDTPHVHYNGHGIPLVNQGRFAIFQSWLGGHETPYTPAGFLWAFDPLDRVLISLLLVTAALFGLLGFNHLRGRPNSRLARIPWPPARRLNLAACLVIVAGIAVVLAWEANSWRFWPLRMKYVSKADHARHLAKRARDGIEWNREKAAKAEAVLKNPQFPDHVSRIRRESLLGEQQATAAYMTRRARALESEAAYYDRLASKYDSAIRNRLAAVEPDPPAPERERFGWELIDDRDYREALKWYDAMIEKYPSWAFAHEDRARILATAPDGQLRDGKAAIASATLALDLIGNAPDTLKMSVLASAYAEAGDFAKAIEWQTRAETLTATSNGKPFTPSRMLLDYRAGKPYRMPK